MRTKKKRALALATVSACAVGIAGGAAAQQKDVMIGEQCDRTGPTQIVGVNLCPAIMDYVNLINSRGGVEGYRIKLDEIDNEYKVPPAVEAYQRHKQQGAISIMLYGTPQTMALTQKLTEDRVPGTSPGFGTSASANGTRYPYTFPIAASYWSQTAAADRLGGLEGKKIA